MNVNSSSQLTLEQQLKTIPTDEEIENHPLMLWYAWEDLRKAIEAGSLQSRVTTVDLVYTSTGTFMNSNNLGAETKLSSTVTPQPIMFGYNKEIGGYVVIRFTDKKHNKSHGLPENVKSFITIYMGVVPHCGIEQFMEESKYVPVESGFSMETRTEFNLDCGRGITDYVINLITGKIPETEIN